MEISKSLTPEATHDQFLRCKFHELTRQDLAEVTQIHLRAFPKSALSLLGVEGVRLYYEYQLSGPHDAVAMGLFQTDRLVGFCFAGIFRGALSGFLRKNKKFLALKVLTHPWLITNPIFRQRLNLASTILKRQRAFSVSQHPAPNNQTVSSNHSFGILSIAIDPDLQGKGYGTILMNKIEGVAADRGYYTMNLSVAFGNAQAIRFYEKNGWKRSFPSDGIWSGSMTKNIGGNEQAGHSI